jgi:hypothetical protein
MSSTSPPLRLGELGGGVDLDPEFSQPKNCVAALPGMRLCRPLGRLGREHRRNAPARLRTPARPDERLTRLAPELRVGHSEELPDLGGHAIPPGMVEAGDAVVNHISA